MCVCVCVVCVVCVYVCVVCVCVYVCVVCVCVYSACVRACVCGGGGAEKKKSGNNFKCIVTGVCHRLGPFKGEPNRGRQVGFTKMGKKCAKYFHLQVSFWFFYQ